jgi:hypothetical protein
MERSQEHVRQSLMSRVTGQVVFDRFDFTGYGVYQDLWAESTRFGFARISRHYRANDAPLVPDPFGGSREAVNRSLQIRYT